MRVLRQAQFFSKRKQLSPVLQRLSEAAQTEAWERHHAHLDPCHLVLAALGQPSVQLSRTLEPKGMHAQEVYEAVSQFLLHRAPASRGPRISSRADVPWSSRAVKVLESAQVEASLSGSKDTGPEHVLSAVLREWFEPAQVLVSQGLTMQLLRSGLPAPREAHRTRISLALSVDQEAHTPLADQIIDQIREAVATGRLQPGDSLPAPTEMAERLGVALQMVVRAYAELVTLGIASPAGVVYVPQTDRDMANRDARALRNAFRRIVIDAFYRGAGADELRRAFEIALTGVYER